MDKDCKLDDLFNQFDNLISQINQIKNQMTHLQTNLRDLEKNVKKQMKGLKKEASKPKIKVNRPPSGFAKPSKVTNELCKFMNKQEGSEIARTEVTKALVSYIKNNKLENEENSKIIYPDDNLKQLLGLDDDVVLTYFTIQKYMNKHFVKNSEL
jgi:upstream activation factor subunit UAF30